jgi:hypothetical protein
MLTDKGAYISPLVSQIRFFFLAKNVAFQLMLQALPYNPQIQLPIMIGIELAYAIGTLWKYMAVKQFKKLSGLVHIVG